MRPQTHYLKTQDGVYLAYQTVGDGPVDLVWQWEWLGNVDTIWEYRTLAEVSSRDGQSRVMSRPSLARRWQAVERLASSHDIM